MLSGPISRIRGLEVGLIHARVSAVTENPKLRIRVLHAHCVPCVTHVVADGSPRTAASVIRLCSVWTLAHVHYRTLYSVYIHVRMDARGRKREKEIYIYIYTHTIQRNGGKRGGGGNEMEVGDTAV